ncbi:TetR/AcrR family transcriptional regulator [Pelagicoccus sp. SDUM812003]|uniref:TetR/AcrR family transcriptional regulator n=1 Tax=Pelagicoccus sp. SDUM812003 TaxID=3041267 RepID=UPI00280DF856|nr:TetR/AcrR family transcriptional regulator [Pelagicoccus sp. SDUM812003]MDQ8201778.1 TetR/AcrR family transcriptional regulator [Pelagicoccus sp. SDUM812003]
MAAYHHGNLKETLIATGLEILRDGGLAALTLRAVARKAGVSPAAPYRHFNDTFDLICSIAEQGFHTLNRELDRALRELGETPPLLGLGQGYLRFATTHPDHLRLMFSGHIPADKRGPSLQSAGDAAFERLVDSIERAKLGKLIDPKKPTRPLALAAWSFVHGFSTLLIEGLIKEEDLDSIDPEELFATCYMAFTN